MSASCALQFEEAKRANAPDDQVRRPVTAGSQTGGNTSLRTQTSLSISFHSWQSAYPARRVGGLT
jgi:hypothetical protein